MSDTRFERLDDVEIIRRIESLSPRQRQVLIYSAQHFTSAEIAKLLNIKPTTVDNYAAKAVERLGVGSRREAAALMIRYGYTSGVPGPRDRGRAVFAPRGENLPTQRHRLSPAWAATILSLLNRPRNQEGRLNDDGDGQSDSSTGMGHIVLRFILDAFYIIFFFAIMSAASVGAHWIVVQCEQRNIDYVVLWILKSVSYLLVGLDAIGVVTATSLLTFRFIRAIARTDRQI